MRAASLFIPPAWRRASSMPALLDHDRLFEQVRGDVAVVELDVVGVDNGAVVRECHDAMDRRAQLAHVAGPRVGAEAGPGGVGEGNTLAGVRA